MSNDTSTLSGALLEMKDQLIYELGQKGVTASYDSSTGLLGLIGRISDIQTGGSCYHIEFSEASYVAVGGSATLEVVLQSNYAPLSGATVTVTGSDSSLYTGITNSQGLAEINVSNITGTVTFTASYSNVTDTCTVTSVSYLFYDACDSSAGLSNYGSSECVRGTNAAMTMTYDSNENAYLLSGSGNYHAYMPIPALKDEDEYTIEADFKTKNVQYNACGFFLDNYNDTTSYGQSIYITCYSNEFIRRQYRLSSDGTYNTQRVASMACDTWYHISMTVNGTSMSFKLSDMNGNQLATDSTTLSISNKSMGILLFCEKGTDGSKCYVRNIVADSI